MVMIGASDWMGQHISSLLTTFGERLMLSIFNVDQKALVGLRTHLLLIGLNISANNTAFQLHIFSTVPPATTPFLAIYTLSTTPWPPTSVSLSC